MTWFSCLCISVEVFPPKLVVSNITASHFLYVTMSMSSFFTGHNKAGCSREAGAHGVHAEVYVLHVRLEPY